MVELHIFHVFLFIGGPIGRLLTFDKVRIIFCFIVLIIHIFSYRWKYISRIKPYFKYILLLIILLTISDLLNYNLFNQKEFIRAHLLLLYPLSFILVIRSIQHIKLFLVICAFFATSMAFFSLFDIVTMSSFARSEIVDFYSNYLYETGTAGLMGTTQVKRAGFLWMSNNSMAYQLGPYFVYFLFMVLKKRSKLARMPVYIISMVIIFSAILSTLSRGGILTVIIGSVAIIFLLYKANFIKLLIYGVTGFIIFIMLQSQMMTNKYYQALTDRYESVFLAVYSKNLNNIEGNAGGRINAAMGAINDIKQKPFFGWGNNKVFGDVGKATRNHVAYLEFIGVMGLIGLLVLFLLWWKTIREFFKSKRLLIYYGLTDSGISHLLIAILLMSVVSGFFQPQSFIDPLMLLISYLISVQYLVVKKQNIQKSLNL